MDNSSLGVFMPTVRGCAMNAMLQKQNRNVVIHVGSALERIDEIVQFALKANRQKNSTRPKHAHITFASSAAFGPKGPGNPIRKCPLCRGVFTTAQNCAPAWQRNSTSHPHSFLDPSGNLTNSSYSWTPGDLDTHPLDYMGDDTINQIAASLFQ